MMNVFNFSKLTMIAVAGMAAVSVSAQAQLADDGSTELLFSKAATAHSVAPKCDITSSVDTLEMVWNYKRRQFHSVAEDFTLTFDIAGVHGIKFFSSGVLSEIGNDVSTTHTAKARHIAYNWENDSIFDLNNAAKITSGLPYETLLDLAFKGPVTGTGDLVFSHIQLEFPRTPGSWDNIADSSELYAEFDIFCYGE